jgi:hypothetical protein
MLHVILAKIIASSNRPTNPNLIWSTHTNQRKAIRPAPIYFVLLADIRKDDSDLVGVGIYAKVNDTTDFPLDVADPNVLIKLLANYLTEVLIQRPRFRVLGYPWKNLVCCALESVTECYFIEAVPNMDVIRYFVLAGPELSAEGDLDDRHLAINC